MPTRTVFVLSALAATLLATPTLADTIKPGTVVCISQKYLKRYDNFQAQGARDFVDDMLARAQCVIKKSPTQAVQLSQVGDRVEVQMLDGFRVWLHTDGLMTDPEAEADKAAQDLPQPAADTE